LAVKRREGVHQNTLEVAEDGEAISAATMLRQNIENRLSKLALRRLLARASFRQAPKASSRDLDIEASDSSKLLRFLGLTTKVLSTG